MADALEPEVVKPAAEENKPVPLTKEGKPFRARGKGKIAALPDEVRAEMDRRLSDETNSYRMVSEWLEDEHAARIGPTSLHYHKKRLDLTLLPVKYATQEAQDIVAATGGDNEEMNRALTMLVQTKIYEMLIQMNTVIEAFDQARNANLRSRKVMKAVTKHRKKNSGEAGSETAEELLPQGPTRAALVAVTALVKNTTTIGHHVIETEKWGLDRDLKLAQQIQVAEQKVSKVAREAGISPEVEQTIRDALMEIKV